MSIPNPETLESLDDVQAYFNASSDTTLLLDRRGKIHLANTALEKQMNRPNSLIMQKTFGDALGCIHTGDHPDGCMYGSICGDCFLHKAMKQALKTRVTVEAAGVLAIGKPGGGVERPDLKTKIIPWFNVRRLYLIMSVFSQPVSE